MLQDQLCCRSTAVVSVTATTGDNVFLCLYVFTWSLQTSQLLHVWNMAAAWSCVSSALEHRIWLAEP